ncbi:MAG: hypothetical protein ACJAT7_000655 [Psychromonas sp.]
MASGQQKRPEGDKQANCHSANKNSIQDYFIDDLASIMRYINATIYKLTLITVAREQKMITIFYRLQRFYAQRSITA